MDSTLSKAHNEAMVGKVLFKVPGFPRGLAPLARPLAAFGSDRVLLEGGAVSPATGKPSVQAPSKVRLLAMTHTVSGVHQALAQGAEGIGLVRTELSYQSPERTAWLVKVILAKTETEKNRYLEKLGQATRDDVYEMLKILSGKPLTVRLLDPSLSEILPSSDTLKEETEKLKRSGGSPTAIQKRGELLARARELHENNPLMGLRGVRLGLVFPEIYDMQMKAILEAEARAQKEGVPCDVRILVPNVSALGEVQAIKKRLHEMAEKVSGKSGSSLPYRFGIMIETPRACMIAEKLAPEVDFFTVGANDLTQSAWALSREDSEGKFLSLYLKEGIIPEDPFKKLDLDGVGALIRQAITHGKAANPNLEVVLAGETASNPQTARFLKSLGFDAVTASVESLKKVGEALSESGT